MVASSRASISSLLYPSSPALPQRRSCLLRKTSLFPQGSGLAAGALVS